MNYMIIGTSDALISGAKTRADKLADSPGDFVNYATIGISGMVKDAFLPEDPFSKEHWENSFGVASLAVGGVKGVGSKGSVGTVGGKETGKIQESTQSPEVNAGKRTGGVEWVEIKSYSANEANNWWKDNMGYENSPYKPGTAVREIELSKNTKFVRVYDGDVSGQFGGWLMKAEDVAGLTPTQIRDKFALSAIPKYITDVNIPANTVMRTGIVNPLEGWGIGGGIQFDLMGQRIGEFTNPRLLP